MVGHLVRMGAVTLVLIACMFLPFLPGRAVGETARQAAITQQCALGGAAARRPSAKVGPAATESDAEENQDRRRLIRNVEP